MNLQPAYTNKRSGFSFIELLVVIAIVLVLGGISAVFYSRFLTQNAVANTVDQVVGEFRKAQIYAMMGKNNVSWAVSISGHTLTLLATNTSAFNETVTLNPSISLSGFSQITYTRMTGIPDISPTITISGAGTTKVLTVNSQGVISR